jgi:hypothetical protein
VKLVPNLPRRPAIQISSALLSGIVFLLYFALISPESPQFRLEITLASSVPDTAQLFFDAGHGFTEQDSTTVQLVPGATRHVYRFPLPAAHISALRFDALNGFGQVTIYSGAILDESDTVYQVFTADDFTPFLQLEAVERSAAAVTLKTVAPPKGQSLDPIAFIRLKRPFEPPQYKHVPWAAAAAQATALVIFLAVMAAAFGALRKAGCFQASALFRASVWVAVLVTFLHLACLPLVVSYDGMAYVHLAKVFFSPTFISDWNFLRTPLFPLLLRGLFFVGGEQPQAALLATTLTGFLGLFLTGLSVRMISGARTGAITIVVLSFFPLLVAYEHMLLSETGTFFCLALLLWILTVMSQSARPLSLWFPFLITLAIDVGYYWRPTIIYLSPFVLLLYVLILGSMGQVNTYREKLGNLQRNLRIAVAGILIVGFGPWLVAGPWLHLTSKYGPGAAGMVLALGAYKQGLIPPGHESVRALNGQYEQVLRLQAPNGVLPVGGLSVADHSDLMGKVAANATRYGLLRLIKENPGRYIGAAGRSMLVFLGVPGQPLDDENGNFSRAVFRLWPAGNSLGKSLGWNPAFEDLAVGQYNGGAALGVFFGRLMPIYQWLILAGSVSSIILLVLSIRWAEPAIAAMAGLPLLLVCIHATTLLSIDRYAVPCYPFFLANITILSARTITYLGRRSVWRSHAVDIKGSSRPIPNLEKATAQQITGVTTDEQCGTTKAIAADARPHIRRP